MLQLDLVQLVHFGVPFFNGADHFLNSSNVPAPGSLSLWRWRSFDFFDDRPEIHLFSSW